jgi:hypothetical protein|tara:strand:+ start:129 stop:263 length:135 start_codon:yes stop_codon:yes gene_type:complete
MQPALGFRRGYPREKKGYASEWISRFLPINVHAITGLIQKPFHV